MNLEKILKYAIGPIGLALLGLVTMPIITWFFSVEDVGRISMLQVVISFSLVIFSIGLDQAYVRDYYSSGNQAQLLKSCVLPGLILLLTFYSIYLILYPKHISRLLYNIDSIYLSFISIVCFVSTFLSRFLSLILRLDERALAYSMSQLVPKILFLLFILSSLAIGLKSDTTNLLTAYTISNITIFFILLWNTRDKWILSLWSKINWRETKPLVFFGAPLVVGGLASWGLNVMDRLFLRSLSSFSELGIYSVAMTLTAAASLFTGIFNTIWSPMIFKWIKEGVNLDKISYISEHLLAAIYFLLAFSGLFSWIILYILPPEYAPIRYLLTICLLGPLFYTLSETTSIGIAISRKTVFSMLASIGAVLINALGNYLLVPKLGALGAAISTAISFWIFYILRTEFACLVWRKTSRSKSYFIMTTLMILSFSTTSLNSVNYILVWFLVVVIGLFIFQDSLNLLIKQMRKVYDHKT